MKLRTLGVVAALALVAGNAQAQDAAGGKDAGWDTKYGIIFTLPNPFGGASGKDVLADYDGKVGFQYNLGSLTGLRLSAKLSRFSAGVVETTAGTTTTETVPAITSSYTANLMGQYMIRLSPSAISPYAGAGAFLNFTRSAKKGEDKFNGTVGTKYDDSFLDYGLGVNGTLGLEWRVAKALSLFAEYQADLTLIRGSSDKTKHTTGTVTAETETKQKAFGNFDTFLANGGYIGVLAFF